MLGKDLGKTFIVLRENSVFFVDPLEDASNLALVVGDRQGEDGFGVVAGHFVVRRVEAGVGVGVFDYKAFSGHGNVAADAFVSGDTDHTFETLADLRSELVGHVVDKEDGGSVTVADLHHALCDGRQLMIDDQRGRNLLCPAD